MFTNAPFEWLRQACEQTPFDRNLKWDFDNKCVSSVSLSPSAAPPSSSSLPAPASEAILSADMLKPQRGGMRAGDAVPDDVWASPSSTSSAS
jgi:hypothetical protein